MVATTRSEAKAQYLERLLSALGGSAQGWEWTGEMTEQDPTALGASPCACGHRGLRYLFHWQHQDGRKLITGSTCVETVPGISETSLEAIQARLEQLRIEKREAERKARDASKNAEVVTLSAALLADIEKRWGYTKDLTYGYWLAPSDYRAKTEYRRWVHAVKRVAKLKTPGHQLRSLKQVRQDFDRCYGASK